ncbi:MAG: hypothetical protein ACXU86_15120, partial [Archangium sp.]
EHCMTGDSAVCAQDPACHWDYSKRGCYEGAGERVDPCGAHGDETICAQASLNPAGANGLLHGNPALLGKQALAVLVVGGYTTVVTLGILKLVDKVLGLRVSEEEERMGLDSTQHGEAAYTS